MCGVPNDHPASVHSPRMGDSPSAAERGAAASPAPLSILVVDDDRVVGQLLADGLAVMGHAVAVAQSAAEAWLLLQDRPDIGVVVSDIRMPGSTGLDLALDVLTRIEDARAASIILVTGHATREEAATALRLGATDVLSKPCRLVELVGAVRTGLETARRRRSGAHPDRI